MWEETDWWLPGFQGFFFLRERERALTAESVSQGVFVSVLKACCVDKVRDCKPSPLSVRNKTQCTVTMCIFKKAFSFTILYQGKLGLLKNSTNLREIVKKKIQGQIHSLQAMSERERKNGNTSV